MSLLVPLTCRSPSISAISSMCSKFYAKTRSYGLLACISPCVGVDVALPYCVYLWQSVSPFLTSLSIWVPSRTTSPFARLSYCNQSCPSSSVYDTNSSYPSVSISRSPACGIISKYLGIATGHGIPENLFGATWSSPLMWFTVNRMGYRGSSHFATRVVDLMGELKIAESAQ